MLYLSVSPDSSRLSLHPAVNVEDVDSDRERGDEGLRQRDIPQILTPQDPKVKTLTVPVAPKGRQR